MSYAEVVSNTRSSIVHACRKESCRACVVFDKEMCDRCANMPRGRLFSRTNQLSKPHKKGAAEKMCACMQACTHMQQRFVNPA